jgi:toxin ParE1/3/4
MTVVLQRALAAKDIDEAIASYLAEHADDAALALVDAIDDAFSLMGRHPGIGTPLYVHELDIPGLRSWSLPGLPYVIFYLEHEDQVDVWRVLHAQRDIPGLMEQPDWPPS